ncbi:fumarylacetoacetate hydrolase family protein [Pseudomaricurvus alkylphenolicus]|uniref:fumarylacetoacetate hydrolase family protein n=1 Tax=Pseudomaricurvus alkylphenolicus TaxID=1306991 RepID=UPI0014234938|nr:fumarylacetoacetate hydrolase family protein [Pseudomaricurvus alkylphenolicus]NIB45000.1 fumarylacetoacetate hydrolase family protein [Pseudomaricurvus alkylphenolicus]
MKFCSFVSEGQKSYGFETADGQIADLRLVLGAKAPATLADFMEEVVSGDISLDSLMAEDFSQDYKKDPALLTMLAPIPRPGKIMGVAINNQIFQALSHRPSATPAFFFSVATALTGQNQPIVLRKEFGITNPEPELAVIIGKGGKNIKEEDALDHVFGYSVLNDVTSHGLKAEDSIEIIAPEGSGFEARYEKSMGWREIRDADHARRLYLTYHARSKGCDTFAPMGPWLVTADEISDPNNLRVRSYQNEELTFVDSTANLTFSVEKVIAHASRYCTLETGDIIHCGTAAKPAENGSFASIGHWDLNESNGAKVSIEIEGLGTLVNPVVVED